ncbi:MAG TPA: hypothetical protein VFN53_00610 [Acidobacteriaceae bacterium]|nr:hypothetical protein [Acidobacteriaceae bacterium]
MAAETGSLNTDGPHPQGDREFVPQSHVPGSPILMIGRDPTLMSYKAAVLGTASLPVDTSFPNQARTILRDGANYDLVILSHTLEPGEAMHIRETVRACNPGTKLLLLLGPGGTPLDCGLFDAAMRGLDGPAALIAKVRELLHTESAPA